MISRLFLIIGLALLGLSGFGFIILNYLLPLPVHIGSSLTRASIGHEMGNIGSGGGVEVGGSTIASSQPAFLIVDRNNPKEMYINTSNFISLKMSVVNMTTPPAASDKGIGSSLDNDLAEYCHNKIGNSNHNQYKPSPYDSCLFWAPIDNIFGPGYEVQASAHLISTSFDIQLLSLGEQSVNQPSIEWDWNISPKVQGMQVINADIELRWKPVGNRTGKEDIVRQVWNRSIMINVNQPPIERGQVSIIPSITGGLGAISVALIAPIFAIWEKRREKKKVEEAEGKDKKQRAAETEAQHELVLQTYLDKMSVLLLEKHLRKSTKDDEVRIIARVWTLMVFKKLDVERKARVFQFLQAADLIDKDQPIIDLNDLDLPDIHLKKTQQNAIISRRVNRRPPPRSPTLPPSPPLTDESH